MPADLVISARFPFGRYAATPWFRSRREHVGNVEWPPSPWRIARALVSATHRLEGDHALDATVGLVQRLAAVEPHYLVPPTGEVVYAQWMPQLHFDDAITASQRSENGHTLLAIDPDRELVIRWPGLSPEPDDRALLGQLLEAVPYLGQSVAVCELRLGEGWPGRRADEGIAVPHDQEQGLESINGDRVVIRLLAPDPSVTRQELEVSTGDGLVKALPVPRGSRWAEYVRRTPRPATTGARAPLVAAVVHRLEGALRPAVAAPAHPEAGRPGPHGAQSLSALVCHACDGVLPRGVEVRAADDDQDGRAERILIRLAEPRALSSLPTLVSPRRRLTGPNIDCALRLERVEWAASPVRTGVDRRRTTHKALVVFRVESARRPLLSDAIVVSEVFRRRLLGAAGRRFGADAVPSTLSGRGPNGPLNDDHRHAHFLGASSDDREIDTLGVWCPGGWNRGEVELIHSVTLPRLVEAPIRLVETAVDPFSGPAQVFRSHTPFLPVRHPKRRGNGLRDSPAEQVASELVRRGFPMPRQVRDLDGRWETFRVVRLAKQGSFPALGAHGFEIEFSTPVAGPIAIGRNSHFGMGVFLPM